MDKVKLLEQIKNLAAQQQLTQEELLTAYNEGLRQRSQLVVSRRMDVAKILYYVGGIIVVLGIVVLINENWARLTGLVRVLVTLGVSITAYGVGLLCLRNSRLAQLGQAFHLIAALALPVGLVVLFDQFGWKLEDYWVGAVVSGIAFVVYLLSLVRLQQGLFLFFTIVFGSWFFFALTTWLVQGTVLLDSASFFYYRLLVTGLSYLSLGYCFQQQKQYQRYLSFVGLLYGFGSLFVLGAALALGEWGTPPEVLAWEVLFPCLSFVAVYLSVYLRSKSLLVFGTGYLVIYIFKITAKYFAQSLGWPVALVLAGFALIGVGYLSLRKFSHLRGVETVSAR